MSSQDTVVAHAPSGTIARLSKGGVEVLRDGKAVGKYAGAHRLSVSKDGLLLIGGHVLLDLAAKFPQQRKQIVVHAGLTGFDACLHPDGDRIWGFRTGDLTLAQETGEDGKPHRDGKIKGVYETRWDGTRPIKEPKAEVALQWASGKRKAVWDGKTDRPKMISLATKTPTRPVDPLTGAVLRVASDGDTWVLNTATRLMIGTGDRLRCNVQWADATFEFVTIDEDGERVICAGKSGIAAVSFDGKPLASTATADGKPIVAPAVLWNGEWVAVLREHDGWNPKKEAFGPATLVIHRYHGTSLVPVARLDAFEPYKTTESVRLLVSEDNALLVVPETETVIALEPPKAKVKAAPAAPKGDAVSPAVKLLTALDDRDAILARLRADPGAFVEHADAVCAWDDKTLARAAKLLPDDFWVLSYGASDAAASDLAKAVKKGKKTDEARAKLLAGISSPIARMAIAELAKKDKALSALYLGIGIETGDRFAAIERFARRPLDLVVVEGAVKHDVRVMTGTAANKVFVDTKAWQCDGELQHVISVDTSALAGFPSMGWFHFFGSGCPKDCDEKHETYTYRVSPDGRLEVIAASSGPKPPAKQRCKGGKPEHSRIRHWALVSPDHPAAAGASGTIGGRPPWQRKPEAPLCPKCERPLFYVGHVRPEGIRSHVAAVWLYGFWCEDCSHGVQVSQEG